MPQRLLPSSRAHILITLFHGPGTQRWHCPVSILGTQGLLTRSSPVRRSDRPRSTTPGPYASRPSSITHDTPHHTQIPGALVGGTTNAAGIFSRPSAYARSCQPSSSLPPPPPHSPEVTGSILLNSLDFHCTILSARPPITTMTHLIHSPRNYFDVLSSNIHPPNPPIVVPIDAEVTPSIPSITCLSHPSAKCATNCAPKCPGFLLKAHSKHIRTPLSRPFPPTPGIAPPLPVPGTQRLLNHSSPMNQSMRPRSTTPATVRQDAPKRQKVHSITPGPPTYFPWSIHELTGIIPCCDSHHFDALASTVLVPILPL